MATQQVKIVIGGNACVGKTSLLHTYLNGDFPDDSLTFIPEIEQRTVQYEGKQVHLYMVDIPGGEMYYRLRVLSYPQTDVFLLCFNVCHKKSLLSILHSWNPETRKHAWDTQIILVGTKSDLRDKLKEPGFEMPPRWDFVSRTEAREAAIKIGAYAYVECSSLRNFNVKQVFDVALKSVYHPVMLAKKPSVMSSLKSKMQKIKLKSKDKPDDKLVICESFTCERFCRYAHASAYAASKMIVIGGYKNLKNELSDVVLSWDGAKAYNWEEKPIDVSLFSPRSSLCAVPIYVAPPSSSLLPPPPDPSVLLSPPIFNNPKRNQNNNNNNNNNTLPLPPPSLDFGPTHVLLFGGKSNKYHNEVTLLDASTLTFQKVDVTGQIPSPRYGMTGVNFENEMIIFGGYDSDSSCCNDCYKFNFEKKEWSKFPLTGDVPSPRYFHSAMIANDRKVMIIHGGKNGANVYDDMFSVDLVSGQCTKIAIKSSDNPGPRQNHTCTYIGRGNILMVGGINKNKISSNELFLFSLDTQKWTKLTARWYFPEVHFHASIYIEAKAEIWISGGRDDANSMRLATKLRVTRNTPRIYEVLPSSAVQDVLLYLDAKSLISLSMVNLKFNTLASDLTLWNRHARESDPDFKPEKHGDPRKFWHSNQSVWFNDFSISPDPLPDNFIAYGHDDFLYY